jgi:hypothetical protein
MIIKAKPLPVFIFKWSIVFFSWFFKRRYNKFIFKNIPVIKPGHSYILMCNHFSFWDGFIAAYLCYYTIYKQQGMKAFYAMSVKKQMQKNKWLQYTGSFSVVPHSRSMKESLAYAAELLSTPGNVLLYYPQGNLESIYIRQIEFKDGLAEIVPQIKGNCQLLWSSNLVEYFESLKPTVYFNLLDCGTNHNFDFEQLKQRINQHHRQAIQENTRFTIEDI